MDSSGNHQTRVRLLLADDQPRVRRGLEALLTALRWSNPNHIESSIEIVGKAGNGQRVVDEVESLHPHVVIIDIPIHHASSHSASHSAPHAASQMSVDGAKMDGLGTIRTIKQRWPLVWVVVLTMYATDRAAVLAAGADVFLLKGCPISELLDAVVPAAH